MPVQNASASLVSAATLQAAATVSNASLDAMFANYQALLVIAVRKSQLWEEAMRAGGRAWASGLLYFEAYQAELAADEAGTAWKRAQLASTDPNG